MKYYFGAYIYIYIYIYWYLVTLFVLTVHCAHEMYDYENQYVPSHSLVFNFINF